jgi:hypothetical protein
MNKQIITIVKSNDCTSLQNYILAQPTDTLQETLIVICRICIDYDNDCLLEDALESFPTYTKEIHEMITQYCCNRGSFKCLKTLITTLDYSITSYCFKTLVTFGRKIRYIKCLKILLEEFELPTDINLYKNCYDIGMFECLLSLKIKGVEKINGIILLRFANQLFEEEEKPKYPLTLKYLESNSLL